MKHYREVKCEDRLPDQSKDQNDELLRFTIPYHLLTESFIRTVGYYDFELKQWFAEDYPETTIEYWLEPFDPEEEAQERWEKAIDYIASQGGVNYSSTKDLSIFTSAFKIASGYNPNKQ